MKNIFEIVSLLAYPGVEKQDKATVFHQQLKSLMFGALLIMLCIIFSRVHDDLFRLLILAAMFMVLIVTIANGFLAYRNGQTYWSARFKSVERARKAANDSKVELLKYAESVKKKAND